MSQMQRRLRRWIYLPYSLVLASLVLSGLASEEPFWRLWPYFVPLLVFLVQLARPTLGGWYAIIAAWFVCCFLSFLKERVLEGGTIGDNWFLLSFGLAPLVPLYIFRPRSAHSVPQDDTRKPEPNGK
jgi:hypothetical protein